jgi:Ca2+-transporting ATPase
MPRPQDKANPPQSSKLSAGEGLLELRVVHAAVPGRLRIKAPALRRREDLARATAARLLTLRGVARVRVAPLTGSVLIEFDAARSQADMLADIARELGGRQAPPTAGSPAAASKVASLNEYRHRRRQDTGVRDAVTPRPREAGVPWHNLSVAEATAKLDVAPASGLASALAARRLDEFGPNALPEAAPRSALGMFMSQFVSLPVGLLAASAGVSVLTGGAVDALVILGVVGINAAIGFATERNAERTIGALSKITPRQATVLRDGEAFCVPTSEVVAGDVLLLSPGDFVAADARLLETHRLTVDESALTGESLPVGKHARTLGKTDLPLAERDNMVYMGTLVTGGSGAAVVVATGRNTELGAIQTLAGEAQPPETPMQRQLDDMGTRLAVLSAAVCGGVFALGLVRGYGLLQMLKSSISLAVAAVPEGLPAVATTTLALGIQDMRRRRVLIRHLNAVESLGSVQVLCMDKTGTLTMNRMAVTDIRTAGRHIAADNRGMSVDGAPIQPLDHDELAKLLQVVSLCSETAINGEPGARVLSGSPTENALVEAAIIAGIEVGALRGQYPRLSVHYRAENRQFMGTVHRGPGHGRLIAVKGSPAEVLGLCEFYLDDAQLRVLDPGMRGTILADNERMAADALRVLGVAFRESDTDADWHSNLTWLGLVGMTDPVRDGVEDLIRGFHGAGINTVMITGDQSNTAYAVGRRLDLGDGAALEVLDSTSLDKVDPQLLAGMVRRVNVFARVSPAHKLQIVQALQRAGKVVAMTGDGINDSPALKAADIGVAMGGSGTDAARSVADVVLADDELRTMAVAVQEGRTIYSNIRKSIHFLLATNLSEIEVMLAGVALGLGEPLSPMQLLWINLISDIFPGLALALEPPEPDVLKRPPRDPDQPIISATDLRRLGIESGVISAGALASYAYAALRYGAGPRAGTHAFMTLTIGQLLHALSCRSEDTTIYRREGRPPNRYLDVALGASLGVQVLANFMPGLRGLLGLTRIGLLDAAVIAAGATLPLLVNEATKTTGTADRSQKHPETDTGTKEQTAEAGIT